MLTAGDHRYLWLDVDYGDGDHTYDVETLDTDRHRKVVGRVTTHDGKGSWAAELDGRRPALVRLVNADGEVWCEARFARFS
jgi:hypothetical protein